MDIYFSYSTKVHVPEQEEINRTLKYAELTVKYAKRIYNNIYFVTDKKGAELFKDIPFSRVDVVLDVIPDKYNKVWSIGKLYAIRHIANQKKHFIHIDLDFLITKKLSENIENAEIILQSIEYGIDILKYNLPIYKDLCKNKYLAEDIETNIAYNCGIIGGKNYSFLYEYADSAIKMVEDPANSELWLGDQTIEDSFAYWTKAVLAEQYHITCILKKHNIEPTLLFDNKNTLNKIWNHSERKYISPLENNYSPYGPVGETLYKDTGCIHFFGAWKAYLEKHIDQILKNIRLTEKQI